MATEKKLTDEELKLVTGGDGGGKTRTSSTTCSVCNTPVVYEAGDVLGEKKYFCPTCNQEYCVATVD